MTIIFSAATYLVAIIIVAAADYSLLRRHIPSLGFISVLMYGVTYGLGLMLWRSDPSSLFGYGSLSTTGALDALLNYFSIGILSLSASYGICRVFLTRFQKTLPQKSLTELSRPHRENLSNLSFLLITLSVLAISVMSVLGLFARSPAIQAQILQSSTIAKVIIGSSIISRLAPIGFFLIPFVWKQWSFSLRFLITTLLSVWQVIAISSGSRGLLISLPVYLMTGALCWQKIPLRLLLISLFASALLFLPLAEHLRVSREGDQSVPELKRAFQTFQIGKQLQFRCGGAIPFYLHGIDGRVTIGIFQQTDVSQYPVTELVRQLVRDGKTRGLFVLHPFRIVETPGRYDGCVPTLSAKQGLGIQTVQSDRSDWNFRVTIQVVRNGQPELFQAVDRIRLVFQFSHVIDEFLTPREILVNRLLPGIRKQAHQHEKPAAGKKQKPEHDHQATGKPARGLSGG